MTSTKNAKRRPRAFYDLREYLSVVKDIGHLKLVEGADAELEIGALTGMMKRRLESRPSGLSTWKEVDEAGYVIVGSPETVRQRLEDYAKKVGFGLLIANFSVGNASREYTERSMRLFAEKVMPNLRPINVDAPA